MRTETIYNPDIHLEIIELGDKRPRFTHFTVERSDPLWRSENPIIRNLIEAGWEVRSTSTQYFMAFPAGFSRFSGHFVFQEREEFEIRVPGKCWLRFRWDDPETVYLALFYVEYEQQGQGLGKIYFPRMIDALFRAGVSYVEGAVSESYYRGKWPVNRQRLIKFYQSQGFETGGNGHIWKYSPYEDSDDVCTSNMTTASESETASVLQS